VVDWYLTKDGDKSCLALYQRHYSAKKAYGDGRERFQFVGPGQSIVLRTARADALFVWRNYIDDTIPKQEGVELRRVPQRNLDHSRKAYPTG
jgi:hypothetical protein